MSCNSQFILMQLKQRFQVIKKLGQGTYGKVQLAVDKGTDRHVAIKTIRKSMVETEQDLVRIRREITIMSSMQHPHIIHIYEVFENKDKIILVMQYAPGGELYEYLSERKVFDDLEARRIFRQISSAIYYCHKHHICHRDLKLENILIDEKGNAKIGDFGLSNIFDEQHFLNTFCGSPLYASPEIVKGTPYYGPEVDCWSLGVLLYTLVYGAMPFDGSNFKRLVKQISESNYYEPKNKSEASPLIRRLLDVNPKTRATIVDICTNNWVNVGYDNSLLQISEDLANLTPVREDILSNGTVSSPSQQQLNNSSISNPTSSSTTITQNTPQKPVAEVKPKQRVPKKAPSSSASQSAESTSGTEQPTSPSVKLTTVEPPLGQTPQTHNESVSPSKKPSKRSSEKQTHSSQPVQVSSSAEEPSEKRSKEPITDSSETIPQRFVQGDKVQRNSSEKVAQKVPQKGSLDNPDVKVLERRTSKTEKPTEKEKTPESTKPADHSLREKDSKEEQHVVKMTAGPSSSPRTASEKPISTCTDGGEKLQRQQSVTKSEIAAQGQVVKKQAEEPPLKSTKKLLERKASIEVVPDQKSTTPKADLVLKSQKSLDKASSSSSSSRPVVSKGPSRDASLDSNRSSERKNSINSEDNSEGGKRNPPLERRSSSVTSRKVGRLSIPNFMELQERSPALKKPVPSYGSIEDAKKKLLERKDSISSESKEHIFPTIPVAEVKSDVERRSSVADPPSLTKGPHGIRFNSDASEETIIKGTRKIMERRSTEPLAMFRTEIKSIELNKETSDETSSTTSSSSRSFERESSLAKEVLKKQMAKNRMSSHRIPEPLPETPEVTSPSPTKDEKVVNESKITLDTKAAAASCTSQPLVESPTSSTNSSVKDVVPASPGNLPVIKPAPITRSYKKVTFTKDGACITETGKVYSQEGPDGRITRVEKKSKVTHYPSSDGASSQVTESTLTTNSNDNSSLEPSGSGLLAASGPQLMRKSSSRSSLMKSESISSSGSTDIFDDIFDTWSGDTMFNNMMSPRLKSLLHPSMFNMKRENSQPGRKTKSRAGSCDRRGEPTTPGSSFGTADDADGNVFQATSSPFSGGLFKFMRENSANQSMLERHRTMFPDAFSNPSDIFSNASSDLFNMPSPFNTKLGGNCQAPGCVPRRQRPSSLVRDSFEAEPDVPYTVTTPRSSISSASVRLPFQSTFIRNLSNSTSDDSSSDTIKPDEVASEVAPRKRVEQWLHMSPTDQGLDPNNPYATVRRPLSRYSRTMSSRLSQDLGDELADDDDYSVRSDSLSRIMSRNSRPLTQLRLNIDSPSSQSVRSRKIYKPSSVYYDPRSTLQPQWEEPVTVPEASTLLQQLQMHGYKNLVNQQILFGPEKKMDDGPLAGQPYRKEFNSLASPTTPTNPGQQLDSPTTPTNANPPVTTTATIEIKPNDENQQPVASSSQTTPLNGECDPTSPTSPTSPNEETVRERIHRKSYYSRFNDEPIRRSNSLTPQMYEWPKFHQ